MRALPALSGRDVIAALERAGFEVIRTKGRIASCRTGMIPAARQSYPFIETISRPGTLRAILRQARLSPAQLLDLL